MLELRFLIKANSAMWAEVDSLLSGQWERLCHAKLAKLCIAARALNQKDNAQYGTSKTKKADDF
jgi:hypothetical protein